MQVNINSDSPSRDVNIPHTWAATDEIFQFLSDACRVISIQKSFSLTITREEIIERLYLLGNIYYIIPHRYFLINKSFYAIFDFYGPKMLDINFIVKNKTHDEAKKEILEKVFDIFKDCLNLEDNAVTISWIFNTNQGQTRGSFYRNIDDVFYQEAYPFIPNMEQYVERFVKSTSNVLLLKGPPGTGKTKFIRYILKIANRMKKMGIYKPGIGSKEDYPLDIDIDTSLSVVITSDSEVINDDGLYCKFLIDNHDFLVLEDIDNKLKPKKDGNNTMVKILNFSDGILGNSGQKIILSTNLASTGDIDPALLRPGRCFDILEFRKLTVDESNKFLEAKNNQNRVTEPKTLSELYNTL